MSFREVRSPEAPKMTITQGSGLPAMAVHDDDRDSGVNHVGAESTSATRGATESTAMTSDEAVTKFFELPQYWNDAGMTQPPPKEISRPRQKSEHRVDGGGASTCADDRPVFIALYEYGAARALVIGHAGLSSQLKRALTWLENDCLVGTTLNGPIAPTAAEIAFAIVEQPITDSSAQRNCHERV